LISLPLQASVPKRLDLMWKFLKPVSFALIGKEINFNVLQGHVIGYGALLVLVGSLVIKMVAGGVAGGATNVRPGHLFNFSRFSASLCGEYSGPHGFVGYVHPGKTKKKKKEESSKAK